MNSVDWETTGAHQGLVMYLFADISMCRCHYTRQVRWDLLSVSLAFRRMACTRFDRERNIYVKSSLETFSDSVAIDIDVDGTRSLLANLAASLSVVRRRDRKG